MKIFEKTLQILAQDCNKPLGLRCGKLTGWHCWWQQRWWWWWCNQIKEACDRLVM